MEMHARGAHGEDGNAERENKSEPAQRRAEKNDRKHDVEQSPPGEILDRFPFDANAICHDRKPERRKNDAKDHREITRSHAKCRTDGKIHVSESEQCGDDDENEPGQKIFRIFYETRHLLILKFATRMSREAKKIF